MDILELIDDKDQTIAESSQRPFQCPEPDCVKSFNRKSDLQRHHRIHTNERPYTCHYRDCGKSFIQRSALTVHIRTHTGEKPHKCEYLGCGKCFSDSSSLARHRRIHTGKRPYRCPIDGCEKSFCRKTTLTKHARRQHQLLDNEGADSEMETEEDVDMSSATPRKSMSARNQGKKAVRRLQQQQQRRQSALLPQGTALFRQNTYIHEPLTPNSPMTLPSSNSSSRNASFSVGFYDSQHQSIMPTTPPTTPPYYEDTSRTISSPTVIHTPVIGHAGSYHNGLRLVLDPQSPEQLLVTAQHLQSSPGSLSSCSSVSSQSSVDYFGRAPQPSTPYQSPYAVSSGSYSNPSTMQPQQHAAQFHPNMHYHPATFHVPQMQPQQVWYEVNQHQHHLISAPPRMDFGYDMPIIKQEETSMLPTPRGSFC